MTVLANSDQTVRDIYLRIPLTARARKGRSFRAVLLPAFGLPSCRDLTGLHVGVVTSPGELATFSYYPGDAALEHRYSGNADRSDYRANPRVDELRLADQTSDREEEVDLWKSLADQTSSNGVIYQFGIHAANFSLSAAQLYSAVMQPLSRPLVIRTSWPSYFGTLDDEEWNKWESKYPEVYSNAWAGFSSDSYWGIRPYFPEKLAPVYPKACTAELEQYFRTAFEKAVLVVVLNQQQNETILFRLHARPPRIFAEGSILEFAIESTPRFIAVKQSDLDDVFSRWPDPVPRPAQK